MHGGGSRGQSEIIGFTLVFGILVLLAGINQAFLVPQDNQDIEAQHDIDVQNDLVELRGGIIKAASSNRQQTTTIRLGTDYPSRLLAVNPSPVTGTIQTEVPDGNENIAVESDGDGDFDIHEVCGVDGDDSLETRFLTYEADYNRYDSGLPVGLENTVKYRSGGGQTLLDTSQTVVRGNQIRIIRVIGDYRATGSRTQSVDLYPSETGINSTDGAITINIPTEISADTWEDSGELLGDEKYVDDVSENGSRVEIEMKDTADGGPDNYVVRCTTIGIEEQPDVNPLQPAEAEAESTVFINPSGNGTLELTDVESGPGGNPDFDLEFTNKHDSDLTLTAARVPYALGSGKSVGDELDFTANGNTTRLTIGAPFNGSVEPVEWDEGAAERIEIDDTGSSDGLALELRVRDEETGEKITYTYFFSKQG
jgi:hypothetical protein